MLNSIVYLLVWDLNILQKCVMDRSDLITSNDADFNIWNQVLRTSADFNIWNQVLRTSADFNIWNQVLRTSADFYIWNQVLRT